MVVFESYLKLQKNEKQFVILPVKITKMHTCGMII